jgi:putative oxidoreductase
VDLGLLILRIVVGALFIGHGTQKLFGWFGGHGLEGTGGFMGSLGYPRGRQMAALAGLGEAGGGTLLLLGFITPVAAAAIIGVMVNAIIAVHLPKGMWNTNGGMEFPLVCATAACALAFLGPGSYSVDGLVGIDLQGIVVGLGALILGLAAAAVILSVRRRAMAREESAPREGGREAA